MYSLLVPHKDFPLWELRSISNIGSRRDLYTTATHTEETDDLERWFAKTVENPGLDSIKVAITNQRMLPSDWSNLLRFYALQELRTPLSLNLFLNRWRNGPAQNLLADATRELSIHLARASSTKKSKDNATLAQTHRFMPFNITTYIEPDGNIGVLKTQLVLGREFWHEAVRHCITETYKALLTQKWTILRAPATKVWPTSDHPSVCFYKGKFFNETTDFGWLTPGAEHFLPLNPTYLLYTKIGCRPPLKGTAISNDEYSRIKTLLLYRAYRHIFSCVADTNITRIRTRWIDKKSFLREQKFWQTFHQRNINEIRQLKSDYHLTP